MLPNPQCSPSVTNHSAKRSPPSFGAKPKVSRQTPARRPARAAAIHPPPCGAHGAPYMPIPKSAARHRVSRLARAAKIHPHAACNTPSRRVRHAHRSTLSIAAKPKVSRRTPARTRTERRQFIHRRNAAHGAPYMPIANATPDTFSRFRSPPTGGLRNRPKQCFASTGKKEGAVEPHCTLQITAGRGLPPGRVAVTDATRRIPQAPAPKPAAAVSRNRKSPVTASAPPAPLNGLMM